MVQRFLWHQMTWPEIAAAAKADAVVIVPAGSIEQHGLHLPTGTDVLISKGLADHLVAAMPERRFIVAPPFRYTIARLNTAYPGTINLNGATLIGLAHDVVAEILRHGFKKVLFLNGHMESVAFIVEGAELALEEHGAHEGKGQPVIVWSNWWEFISDALIAEIFGSRWPGWEAEHAALTETSLMAHLCPDLVRDVPAGDNSYQKVLYKVLPWPARTRPKSGSYADPTGADAATGRRLAEAVVDGLKRVVAAEF